MVSAPEKTGTAGRASYWDGRRLASKLITWIDTFARRAGFRYYPGVMLQPSEFDDAALADHARELGQRLAEAGLTLSLAESCTGGWIAKCLTDIAGSSGWFERGWVTYSNAAKTADLDVPATILESEGAVSEPVARAMADGARRRAGTDLAVSVSGVAGPGGGSDTKPVGMVCFGLASTDCCDAATRYFDGDREAVRRASVAFALQWLIDYTATVQAGERRSEL